jgi:predicted O-linked N-acetylglucosamine transferase (SPINDLY family)
VGALEDTAIVAQIRADGIDVLVDLTGHTPEYIEKAVAFAQDAEGMAAIRARLSLGPLADAATYARGLEAAWRFIWRDWCAR